VSHQCNPIIARMENRPCIAVGDICVDKIKFNKNKATFQRVQIRKFSSDGTKAIVHYEHCPEGMVIAVNLDQLRVVRRSTGGYTQVRR
jgi:hypothetical protein